MSVRLIPIHPANLITFEEGRIFGAPFGRLWRPKHPFWTSARPNAIWCDMKFYAHHFISTLRISYVKMATSEGGRGGSLHILSLKKTDSSYASWDDSCYVMQNAIWCNTKFYAHHFLSTFRIFYVKMAISEGGGWRGGFCISLVVTGPMLRLLRWLLLRYAKVSQSSRLHILSYRWTFWWKIR